MNKLRLLIGLCIVAWATGRAAEAPVNTTVFKVALSMSNNWYQGEQAIAIKAIITNELATAVQIKALPERPGFPFIFRVWHTNGQLLNPEPIETYRKSIKGTWDHRRHQTLQLKPGANTFEFELRNLFAATAMKPLPPAQYRVDALLPIEEPDPRTKPRVKVLKSNSVQFELRP